VEIERLYTVVEAAGVLRVSPWTVRAWLAEGRLRRKKLGSRVVITASQLQEVIDQGLKLPKTRVRTEDELHTKAASQDPSGSKKAPDSRSVARREVRDARAATQT
jgi:excisionase family DNA binding protein